MVFEVPYGGTHSRADPARKQRRLRCTGLARPLRFVGVASRVVVTVTSTDTGRAAAMACAVLALVRYMLPTAIAVTCIATSAT